MKKFTKLILLGLSFLLYSCATIVCGTKHPIYIDSNPKGAKITIVERKGKMIYEGKTPASLKIKAGSGYFTKASYNITFQMNGYESKTISIDCILNDWYYGNFVFGNLIGFLIIDPITGAMWELEKDYINEYLNKTSASIQTPSLRIYNLNEIPENFKDRLVRIN